ncbi:MAG: hypothetical protein U1E10_15305 [Bdellovibrionales bacterium]|nr:hypothetical protein [Bdellovibrionales bacterium]
MHQQKPASASHRWLMAFIGVAFLTTTAPHARASDSYGGGASVPNGWAFTKKNSDSLIRAHPDQIGILQETKTPSHFLTAPVILRRAKALSTRTSSAKLVRLEKEVAAFIDGRNSKASYRSAKIIDEIPTIELELGKPGRGMYWVFATVKDDSILLIAVDSREATPPSTARQEFFAMARAFKP